MERIYLHEVYVPVQLLDGANVVARFENQFILSATTIVRIYLGGQTCLCPPPVD